MSEGLLSLLDAKLGITAGLKRLVRNRRLMVWGLIVAVMAGMVFFGNHGVLQRIRLQHEKAEMERKIQEAEAQQRALQEQSKALDTDKKAIEKVAREKYGMARKGETVYKVKKQGE